jgi:hypothetical protein
VLDDGFIHEQHGSSYIRRPLKTCLQPKLSCNFPKQSPVSYLAGGVCQNGSDCLADLFITCTPAYVAFKQSSIMISGGFG